MSQVLRLLLVAVCFATIASQETLAEPLIIAPDELIVRYERPTSVREPIGSALEREWADVSSKVLNTIGLSGVRPISVNPLHQRLFDHAKEKNLTENLAALSLISEIKAPSARLAKSVLITNLSRSAPAYRLLTSIAIRFSKPIDVSAAVDKIQKLTEKNLSSIGLAGYKVIASGVQLIDYSAVDVDAASVSQPSGDLICQTSPRERVAIIGVGFSKAGMYAPSESYQLSYTDSKSCSRAGLTGDQGLLGAHLHGVVKRVCPGCETVAFDAGCGAQSRSLLPFSNLAQALVRSVLRDASVILAPIATVNERLAFNAASELAFVKDADVVVVASAGDFSSTVKHHPAAYSDVIGVAALDQSGKLSNKSNSGSWVSTSTMGVRLRTDYGDNEQRSISGTSAAASVIAARVALFRAIEPQRKSGAIVEAGKGGLFEKRIEFVCKEQPDQPPVSSGGAASSQPSQGTKSSAPSSPPADGPSGGARSSSSGNSGVGNGSTAAGDTGQVPQVTNPGSDFAMIGSDLEIQGRNFAALYGDGSLFYASSNPTYTILNGKKNLADRSLEVASSDKPTELLKFEPPYQPKKISDPFRFRCNASSELVNSATAIFAVALSDVKVADKTNPIVTFVLFEQDSGIRKTLKAVEIKRYAMSDLVQVGERLYAIFRINKDLAANCLTKMQIGVNAPPNVQYKIRNIAYIDAQGYRDLETKYAASSSGFMSQFDKQDGINRTNSGQIGYLQFGPSLKTSKPIFMRTSINTLQNPQTSVYQGIVPSEIVSDISIANKVLSGGTGMVSDWVAVPPTNALEFRAFVKAKAKFDLTSTSVFTKALTYFDESYQISASQLAALFGRPSLIPEVKLRTRQGTTTAATSNLKLLGEFTGAGYAIVRDKFNGVLGDVRYIASVSSAYKKAGKEQGLNLSVAGEQTAQGDLLYDQVLRFDTTAEQPAGIFRVVVQVVPADQNQIEFNLNVTNQVTKQSSSRAFRSENLIIDATGKLWALIDLPAEISAPDTAYRFTMQHTTGTYTIEKVLFYQTKDQKLTTRVVPARFVGDSNKIVEHEPFVADPATRSVVSIFLEGAAKFGIPVVYNKVGQGNAPITYGDYSLTYAHYNFLTANLSLNGAKALSRSLSTAITERLPITDRQHPSAVSCTKLPSCFSQSCIFTQQCDIRLGVLETSRRQALTTISISQSVSPRQTIATQITLNESARATNVRNFHYIFSEDTPAKTVYTQEARAEIFTGE